ncbi:MAG: SAM-dependent methyltransferase [Promethearchaeota archaeon]|nr:MAG: SAM-dependent methyltransferase [Candidatus Lokiarchaeota archaeon]
MINKCSKINSEWIEQIFGLSSSIFEESLIYLETQSKATAKKRFDEKYQIWSKQFEGIYGKNIEERLFLKHTYLAQIHLILILIKFFPDKNPKPLFKFYKEIQNEDYKKFDLAEFSFFNWINLDENIFKDVHDSIGNFSFHFQDLFCRIYQEIFYASTRHKIGEFYTPPSLVYKMTLDSYQFGEKILDPSCGSGSFIISIMREIIQSNKDNNAKLSALNKVYGFDINPLATLTTKSNILLNLKENWNKELDDVKHDFPNLNIYILDSLFPQEEKSINGKIDVNTLYHDFDQIIGNPPWLTYKDLLDKAYQDKIRKLADDLNIKPKSQYITHIELSSIFFYSAAKKFLKKGGKIFFVVTKSLLNGDHCFKFRSFALFKDLEIWDFPDNYFFNVEHICLKAKYIGENKISIKEKYPIKVKIFDENIDLIKITEYSSLKIKENGAKIIKPMNELKIIEKVEESPYKKEFKQGATLVPKSLVFFKIEKEKNDSLIISSDEDIISRGKKKWRIEFYEEEIEKLFRFATFLNRDMVPFYIKKYRDVFLPIKKEDFEFDLEHLKNNPYAYRFYSKMNTIYKEKKKETSDINDLFSNLNYWNKLTKQINNKDFLVVYNSSGSTIKSSVIDTTKERIVIGSQNYYYSTDSINEAYYLCAILNAPILSKYIRVIKSSRHIHKRPFSFPIPIYDEKNEAHKKLALTGKKSHSLVHDIVYNNKRIKSKKVRTLVFHKLKKIDVLTKKSLFK